MKSNELRFTVVASDRLALADVVGPGTASCSSESIRWCEPSKLQNLHLSTNDILIIALGEELSADSKHKILCSTKDFPSLGLIPPSEELSTDSHAKYFTEVAHWPGDVTEVSAKIDKLYRNVVNRRQLEQHIMLNVNVVGHSPSFKKVLINIGKYSKCDAPVLITGETGTGKEKIARAIHYLGAAEQPFVAVNCGAIPDALVENELFGHVRGAYTDARQTQCGLVEQAEGGTLFLDEIEALSLKGQVALLRFLQDYEYRPLGAQKSKQANIRLITATNEPLETLVENSSFRKDLFYRINILALHIPPLRERGDDVVCLAEHFIDKYRDMYQQYDKYLDPHTLEWMSRYDWPGNVRELENLILREFLLADTACISIPAYEGGIGERRRNVFDRRYRHLYRCGFQEAKAAIIGEFERSYLSHVLNESRGNVSEAARRAGKERRTFAKLMEKHDLGKKEFIA